ncbi:MAG: Periplasmic protein [Candidatus Tokpelaia hoelldobleri]|uniref:Periplasmic protein n=1 Tax=Candidatus Tokpelaia hoelldobleri TaxID=1902579 RepID=A0A1U9JTE6_9HYPH|nr:MAG: Periplasmic protein [Candidatus Tokpelaia hoelldoblerii]
MFLRSVLTATALVFGISAASAQTIGAPAGKYVNDATHTNVLWSVNHFGLSTYYGRFDDTKIKLDLADPSKPETARLSVTINPKSVDTNFPGTPNKFSAEIAGEKFFNAAKFKTITFNSTAIKVTGDKTGEVTGDLTFHGVTKPVTLSVTFNKAYEKHPMSQKPAIGFSATGQIRRSDFGVDFLANGPVSDEVDLVIETEFTPE